VLALGHKVGIWFLYLTGRFVRCVVYWFVVDRKALYKVRPKSSVNGTRKKRKKKVQTK
jgi:hypothetical protein